MCNRGMEKVEGIRQGTTCALLATSMAADTNYANRKYRLRQLVELYLNEAI